MVKQILQRAVNGIPWRFRSTIKTIPILAASQSWLMRNVLTGESFLHRINAGPAQGLVYPVVLPDDKQIWIGTYEQDFSETLAAAVRPESSCYDIGGYRGFFAGVMACRGASSVHVFEPLPPNAEQIRRMAALNPRLPLHVHEMALADVAGETTFAVMPATSMGKLSRSEFDSGNRPTNITTVKVETVDQMIAQNRIPPADLIKIDVEGAEILVLQGAMRLIRDRRPTLFIEVHSRDLAQACFAFLQQHGYGLKVLETGEEPNFSNEPEVCHIQATASSTTPAPDFTGSLRQNLFATPSECAGSLKQASR